MVQNPPEGYHSITPYLIVEGAADFLAFAKTGLGAKPRGELMEDPRNGLIGHGECKIGNSVVMFADAMEGYPATRTLLHVYVDDLDAAFHAAVAAGAKVLDEPRDQFYGDRTAQVEDKWGNRWYFGQHMEDVSPDEMMARMEAQFGAEGS
ncbi:MAG: VOC family protein [Thermoplasmatota archaeon]